MYNLSSDADHDFLTGLIGQKLEIRITPLLNDSNIEKAAFSDLPEQGTVSLLNTSVEEFETEILLENTVFPSESGGDDITSSDFISIDATSNSSLRYGASSFFTSVGLTGDSSLDYNVTIGFGSSLSTNTELRQAFENAANLVSEIITSDIGHDFPSFRYEGVRYPAIDDILISAELTEIDGVGGTLGQAGPELIATETQLPITAIMEFDTADAEALNDEGLFGVTVFHEMMHSLGLGTLWSFLEVSRGYRYIGSNAIEAYNLTYAQTPDYDPITGRGGIPIEDDFGPGTAGGHWEEGTVSEEIEIETRPGFKNEIMTGFIDDSNYLSTMSIASLEDLGYETVWSSLYADYLNTGELPPLVYENSVVIGEPLFA